ncbi:MAG: 16S rRNA processing protein RimM [Ruminococcaceae bacterium]|nr:16S rRNA processing protein RimM [Oscillospiraceae bacterium]
MKKTFLNIGKIVGSHGIKGMVRVECWCDSPEFLCQFKRLFTSMDLESALKVNKASAHKNIALVKFKGIDTIEQAETMRGNLLYIYRDDAKLNDGQYFIDEIIGSKIYDGDTNEFYGTLVDVSNTGANDIWQIKNGDKEFLFPSVPHFVKSIDIEKEVIYILPPKGIFDDED